MPPFMIAAHVLGLILLWPGATEAQSRNCAPRDTVVDRLTSKYSEGRKGMGLGAQGAVVEIFASDESGTWTITVTTPNGLTCLVASGQNYETLSEQPRPGEREG